MPRRPINPHFRFAAPVPWRVAGRVDHLIVLESVPDPTLEPAVVPINGNFLQAEHNAALIEYLTQEYAAGRIA